jgi:hypothetical protein
MKGLKYEWFFKKEATMAENPSYIRYFNDNARIFMKIPNKQSLYRI